MSNETIPVIPNDEEQRSLRGSGLILSATTDDSDFTKTKEGYSDRLEGILDNPLSPENFSTYADDALDQVVKLADDMLTKSPYQGLPLPSGILEDYISKSYGIDIGKVLDKLTSKVDETKEIKDYVAKIGVNNDIYVPPQVLSPKIESGKGEFTEAEVVPKLETILFLLKEMHGIDLQDSEQIVVTRGTVDKNMMRNEPYYSIQIPELNRTILVCNEKGNITYILDSEMLAESMPDLNLEITDLDKGKIDQLIKDSPSLGARIRQDSKYITKIEDSLDEIANFDEAAIDDDPGAKEVSLLADIEKAPDGYLSINGIAKEIGLSERTIRKIIGELADELGESKHAKYSGKVLPSFSPDQIEKIRVEAESSGVLNKPLEGYLSASRIVKEMGIGYATLKDIIGELGDELGEFKLASFRGTVVPSFSPEQIEKIRVEAESRGLFKKPPEGYFSARSVAKEMGLSHQIITNIIGELGDELGEFKLASFRGQVVPSFSPEQIEKIRVEAESRGLFKKPLEGYLSVNGMVEEIGLSHRVIKNIIGELGDELGEVKLASFRGTVVPSFSPEQIEKIRVVAESRGVLNKPLEGYLSAKRIEKEMGIGYATLKDIIGELGDELGEVKLASYGGQVAPSFSPDQIEKIRVEAESRGLFNNPPKSS